MLLIVVSEVAATTVNMDTRKSLIRMKDMTTKFGIVQHSNLEVPDTSFYYSVDDSSRGLIALARCSDKFQMKNVADVYLSYAEGAFRDDGFFENYRSPAGVFGSRGFGENENPGDPENPNLLKDCFGRTVWSLAEFAASEYSTRERSRAKTLIDLALGHINLSRIDTEKSLAFLGIGLSKILEDDKRDYVVEMAFEFGEKLHRLYEKHSDKDWRAYSDEITYCAARTSHAMLALGEALKSTEYIGIGMDTLEMLNKYTFDKNLMFHPIGNGNPDANTTGTAWLGKGKLMALFDAQSVEAGCAAEALAVAERLRPGEGHGVLAKNGVAWYHGKNSAGIKMVRPSGAVYDSITGPRSVNENCGAEPLVMYLNASAAIRNMAV